jgi:hypothetical protein
LLDSLLIISTETAEAALALAVFCPQINISSMYKTMKRIPTLDKKVLAKTAGEAALSGWRRQY